MLLDDVRRWQKNSNQTERLASRLAEEADAADRDGRVSASAWSLMRDAGLFLAPFPARLGGEDLLDSSRTRPLFDIFRLLGWADLNLARLFEGHVNAVALVKRFGTSDQLDALARRVARGAASAVWGADGDVPARAEPCDAGFTLVGSKIYASGAGLIQCPLVALGSPAGQIMCLVSDADRLPVDLTSWTAVGMRSSVSGSINLDGQTVPHAHVIGSPGDFTTQPMFAGGVWRYCAAHVGAMTRLIELFKDHLNARGRSGDAYQGERMAAAITAAGTARLWAEEASRRYSLEQDRLPETVAFAHLTRLATERAGLQVMEAVQRGVGLQAMMAPNPIERIARDLSVYLRQPVPDAVMADAARSVLQGHVSVEDLI